MKIHIAIIAVLLCSLSCRQQTESTTEEEYQWHPVGSIVDATESNAQQTLYLSLDIDGVTSNHVTTWHYRILQKGEEADMGIGAHMSHADGGGGGYSIYVSPTDSMVHTNEFVEFNVSYRCTHGTNSIKGEDKVHVPFFKDANGKTGKTRFAGKWAEAEQIAAPLPSEGAPSDGR